MTCEQLLELTTEQLETASDAELLVLLGPAVANCQVLPGSDEEKKQQKAAERLVKLGEKQLALEAAAAKTTNNVNGVVLGAKRQKGKKTSAEKMKELLAVMAAGGVKIESLVNDLPKELGFKQNN